jgi:alkanesulfonate monooxygenase SsuD/methylene tetrahydromethanopterin reductase-like flavin-dependent oxidoreductase (luciferase family)
MTQPGRRRDEDVTESGRFTDAPHPAMPRIGIALTFQRRPDLGEPFDRAYREGLELAAEADRLGIDDIWLPEHHGEDDGYNPSPAVMAGAIAAVTRRVRICYGISLAPLQGHPLRIAEDLAVVDNVSGGRVEPGFGQGYRRQEFAAMGLPFGGRSRAFAECLDVVDLAWRGDRFDYAGEIHQVRGGLVRPAPVRPGRPPLWLGAAAPRSRARAAARGAGLVIAPLTTVEHTARQFADHEAAAADAGTGYLPHAIMREIEVGDTDDEALDAVLPYLDHVYLVQYPPERTGATRIDPATGERRPLTGDDPYYLSRPFIDERWAIGSPATCARRVASWLDTMRLDRLVFHPKQPGRPLADAVTAMRRVVDEVLPAVAALRRPTAGRGSSGGAPSS